MKEIELEEKRLTHQDHLFRGIAKDSNWNMGGSRSDTGNQAVIPRGPEVEEDIIDDVRVYNSDQTFDHKRGIKRPDDFPKAQNSDNVGKKEEYKMDAYGNYIYVGKRNMDSMENANSMKSEKDLVEESHIDDKQKIFAADDTLGANKVIKDYRIDEIGFEDKNREEEIIGYEGRQSPEEFHSIFRDDTLPLPDVKKTENFNVFDVPDSGPVDDLVRSGVNFGQNMNQNIAIDYLPQNGKQFYPDKFDKIAPHREQKLMRNRRFNYRN